jgi:hypothetical protein
MRSLSGFVAALALAVVAAGCGGGAGGGAGGDAAGVVPAGTLLYISGNTDFEGDQWQTAADLVRRFPDGEKAVSDLLAEFESEEGVDFEEDVKPAVGPEVAVAVLEFPTDGSDPPVVALTQPEDEQKLQALLEKGDEPTVSEQVEGWTVISDLQSSIDRFKEMRGDGALADSEDFQDAMSGLESDSLVSVYFNGEALDVSGNPELSPMDLDAFLPGGKIPAVGAILRAEDEGARFDGQAIFAGDVTETGLVSSSFEAKLPDEVPGDVLAYFSFNDLEGQFSAFRDSISEVEPDFGRQLGQAEAFLGVSLEEDIAPLFAGEGAVYVRPGAPIPEITLLTTVDDVDKAVATLDDLVAGLGQFMPVQEPTRLQIAGVEARQLQLESPFSLFYAAFDGRLVVTTSRQGIADLREDGDHFADDEAFNAAADTAGLPEETTGWGYVNLEKAIPLVLDYVAAAGEAEPPEVRANIEPLRSLIFWGTAENRTATFSLFVGVD